MTTPSRPPVETPALRSSQMALPPAEISGVILNLSPHESKVMFDWVLESIKAVETAISEEESDQRRENLYEQLSSLAIIAQSCTSGAALNIIYEPPERTNRHHFVFMQKIDAMAIIKMMEATPNQLIQQLCQTVIRQVDKAFIQKYEFANVPTR